MNEEDRYRSVFARVAQYQENVILTSMRKFLQETGWKEMALIYDGFIVGRREGLAIDYKAMQKRIYKDTHFDIRVTDKPFCDGPEGEWPKLSLAR